MSDPHLEDIPTEALVAIRSGRKIEAIRVLREQTGMGLAEAKSVVDRASRSTGPQMPRMAAGREDSGLLRLLAVVVVLSALAAALLLL